MLSKSRRCGDAFGFGTNETACRRGMIIVHGRSNDSLSRLEASVRSAAGFKRSVHLCGGWHSWQTALAAGSAPGTAAAAAGTGAASRMTCPCAGW